MEPLKDQPMRVSYVVTIRRELPIGDLRLLIEADPELMVDNESDGDLVFVWQRETENET